MAFGGKGVDKRVFAWVGVVRASYGSRSRAYRWWICSRRCAVDHFTLYSGDTPELGCVYAPPLVAGVAVAVGRWTALPIAAVVSACLSPPGR